MAKRQYTSTIASAVEQFGQENNNVAPKRDSIEKPVQQKEEEKTSELSVKPLVTDEDEGSSSAEKKTSQKQKIGRPKGEDLTHISLGIPSRLYEQISGAALIFGGNKTKYIVSLIEADIKKNGKTYSNLANMVNDAKI